MKNKGLFSNNRRDALKRLLEKDGLSTKRTGIPRREHNLSHAPLSFAQQRLWFLNQMGPGNTAYNIPFALRLNGTLNSAAMEQSLNEITKRHEILRTTFQLIDSQPMQVIAPDATFSLPLIDLQHLPEEDQQATIVRMATEELQTPFNLETGPLLRGKLLKLAPKEHILLLTMHHIVSDAWSIGVLSRETAAIYTAFVQGKSSPLPELPIQYADFAIWQREWLQGDHYKTQLAYWKEQLTDAPMLELPTDRPRPAIQTFSGAQFSFQFSQILLTQLRAFSQQESATLFMTLLTAFKVLLYRYTGQSDIVVGSPIADRNQPEVAGVIGFFVNTLALRTNLSGNPTFRELTQRVRQTCLKGYANQNVQFEQLVEELHLKRDLSHPPLFQVMLLLQNKLSGQITLPELTLEVILTDSQAAKFDITLSLAEAENGLTGILEYNTDLFDADTIVRMSEHLETLLEGIVANPDCKLSDLPILPPLERQRILQEWNATEAEYPQSSGIHELFEAQVERTPDAVAVVFEQQSLTYHELNQRANQLAHYLRKLGVGSDMLVGLCLERSLEMVIGLLGILKAGAAYLPLDPNYPQERLAYMLEDSGASVLLSQEDLLAKFPQLASNNICLDRDWEKIANENITPPESVVQPNSLAYVIYTSGSTGKPKGTMISHSAIINHMRWMQTTFPLSTTDSVLQKTPFSFDASVWEFYAPLLVGGRLIMACPGGHQDSAYLCEEIIKQNVTTLQLVPSLLRVLLDDPAFKNCLSLKRVFCGGEALPGDLVESFFASLNAELNNLYGPTEATIDATSYSCKKEATQRTIPIGRPIANTQIYLLDQNFSPVPTGVFGELYISGAGLARGYYHRPALTAEKFLPNPFVAADDPRTTVRRLYRTGDLARWLPDGNIEYASRIDHQVKVRGMRIELGEIEAALSEHPAIQTAAVLVREDIPGHRQLTAYLVTHQNITIPTNELTGFLKTHLPEYMVPTAFSFLDQLPLTPNGKIDRKALPAPTLQHSLTREYVAPRTPAEETLAAIWSQILGVEQVGIHDNFFEIGGDSLLSMHVITRARQAGLDLRLTQIFQHQTIAELADVANISLVTDNSQPDVPITGAVPLTPNQHWYFDQNFEQQHYFNVANLFEVSKEMKLDPHLVEKVIRHLLIHHDGLRSRFVQQGSEWTQFIAAPDAEISFLNLDLSTLPAQEQIKEIEVTCSEAQTSLNLSDGPLLRVIFFDLGSGNEKYLFLLLHHLITDGFSTTILMQDFMTAYQQLSQGQPVKLPAKTSSVKYWSECLVEYAQSPAIQQELNHWQTNPDETLPGIPPADVPDPSFVFESTFVVSGMLPAAETRVLLQEVLKTYNMQLIEVMLATMAEAIGQTKGDRSLYVDILRHGRDIPLENIDLSRTIGWFVIHYPLLLRLENVGSLVDALPQVREQYRRPVNGGIGYDLLRYMSGNHEIQKTLRPRPVLVFSHESFEATAVNASSNNEALIRPSSHFSGWNTGGKIRWPYLLELRTIVANNQLHWSWTTGETAYQRATIEQLSQSFGNILKKLCSI